MSDQQVPSAKSRLQASREALMHQLQPSTRGRSATTKTASAPVTSRQIEVEPRTAIRVHADESEPNVDTSASDGMWTVVRHSLRAWWQFHPARAAIAIAEPVLEDYAQRKPFKLLGIAAGIGATIVVTRPWKLVSVGSLAVAALKSSQVSNLALSMLSFRKKKHPKDHE